MAALLSTLAVRAPQSSNGPALGDKRLSLLLALTLTASSQTQKRVQKLFAENIKSLDSSLQRISRARSLEEALMTVPELETIPYRVIGSGRDYEIREVESYLVAETNLPGYRGFEFMGSSQAFNTIASYLFGKNAKKEEMEMTTPVLVKSESAKLEMTTPVISSQTKNSWRMAFVMPSKYTEDTLPVPVDTSVTIRRVPPSLLAVTSFSGFVTDEEVKKREERLRKSLENDKTVRVKPGAEVQVAQYNPPFTPPVFRRNEVALEVERATSLVLHEYGNLERNKLQRSRVFTEVHFRWTNACPVAVTDCHTIAVTVLATDGVATRSCMVRVVAATRVVIVVTDLAFAHENSVAVATIRAVLTTAGKT